MNIIPLEAELVKGSHGRIPESTDDYPILISSEDAMLTKEIIDPTDVFGILEDHVIPTSPHEKPI